MHTAVAVLNALRVPGIYLLLALSAALWALAYQHKTVYVVDVGGTTDDAYVSGFHAKEHNADLNYRWTTGRAVVTMPGVGNQRVELSLSIIGFRPAGAGDPPTVTVETRAGTFQVQTTPQLHTYTFFVDRGDRWQGDFRVVISSPTFSPPGDPRPLGVLVDRVEIAPADYSWRSVVIPPVGAMVSMLGGLALLYMAAAVTTRRPGYALAWACALALSGAALIVYARPELGLLAGQLPGLALWGLLMAALGRTIADLCVPRAMPAGGFVRAAASSAFALAFIVRFGGLTYPQFLTSDILLHVHYIQDRVLKGQWVFPGLLPDGTPVPYPPAFYVLVAPLTAVWGSSDEALSLVLKWAASALDAATCLALAWAASRLWPGWAGGWAALFYALSPAPFELFSAGNYTNLFAQSVLNITLLAALALLAGAQTRTKPEAYHYALLTAGFFLTAVGHYGVMLSMLVVGGLFAVWAVLDPGMRGRRRVVWPALMALVVALAAGYVLYYWHFTADMWNQLSGVLQRLVGVRIVPAIPQAPEPLLSRFARKLDRLVGTMPLLGAVFGSGLWLCGSVGRAQRAAVGLMGAWLAASALFFLLDQTLGDAVRWYYLAAAPVSMLAGGFAAQLTARGRVGRALSGLVLAAVGWSLLLVWVGELILTRYH
jgi:hypothetical protein